MEEKKILIADDDAEIRYIVRTLLENDGLTVVEASMEKRPCNWPTTVLT